MRVSPSVLVIACAVAANAQCDPQFAAQYAAQGIPCPTTVSSTTVPSVANQFSNTFYGTGAVLSNTVPSTTVPSSTFLSNTVPSTTVLSNTVPSSTFLSNTVPSTTVLSNTVPSSTFLSNTVPSSTFLSNTVPSYSTPRTVSTGSYGYPYGYPQTSYTGNTGSYVTGNYPRVSSSVGITGNTGISGTSVQAPINPCNVEDPPDFCDFQTVEPFDYTFPEISWPSPPSSYDASVFGSRFTNGGIGLDPNFGATPDTVTDEIYDYYDYYNYLTFADDTAIPFGTAVSNPLYNSQTAYSNFNYNPYEAASLYNSASADRAIYGVNSNSNIYSVGSGTSFYSPQTYGSSFATTYGSSATPTYGSSFPSTIGSSFPSTYGSLATGSLATPGSSFTGSVATPGSSFTGSVAAPYNTMFTSMYGAASTPYGALATPGTSFTGSLANPLLASSQASFAIPQTSSQASFGTPFFG